MITWFLSLKKTTKITLIIAFISLVIILYFGGKSVYWKYQYLKTIEKELKEIEKENKQLKKDFQALYIDRQKLDKIIDKKNKTIDSLKLIANKLKDETKKIPDVVRTYPDRKLDSILTNHRHIQRSEN